MHEMNFRRLPKAQSYEDSLMDGNSLSVAPNDVFPEQLPTYVFPQKRLRDLFLELHPELAQAEFWQAQQQRIAAGILPDIFPYPQDIRFLHVKYDEKSPLPD